MGCPFSSFASPNKKRSDHPLCGFRMCTLDRNFCNVGDGFVAIHILDSNGSAYNYHHYQWPNVSVGSTNVLANARQTWQGTDDKNLRHCESKADERREGAATRAATSIFNISDDETTSRRTAGAGLCGLRGMRLYTLHNLSSRTYVYACTTPCNVRIPIRTPPSNLVMGRGRTSFAAIYVFCVSCVATVG